PALVASGRYQMGQISRLLPLRPRRIIPLGVGEPFITAHPVDSVPPRRAVYSSQAYRGFTDCVRLWIEHIRPAVPDAELVAFVGSKADCGYDDAQLAANGVVRRERVDK